MYALFLPIVFYSRQPHVGPGMLNWLPVNYLSWNSEHVSPHRIIVKGIPLYNLLPIIQPAVLRDILQQCLGPAWSKKDAAF